MCKLDYEAEPTIPLGQYPAEHYSIVNNGRIALLVKSAKRSKVILSGSRPAGYKEPSGLLCSITWIWYT
jgi:hypothetical protein